uniref:Oleosin-2 n=1 Tax=Cosmarium turpinii TaxID=1302300 RepID=M4N6X5_9VIRI|nr:oleosin-2 [Cosmarium turpinii]
MSYGKYDPYGRQDLPSDEGWKLKDVVFLLGTLGAAGTLATVVLGTVVIGGGALLIIGVPLFLLFSPILVPGGIIATIVGGGFLTFLAFTAAAIGGAWWLWNYFTGKQPTGTETVEGAKGRVKGMVGYGQQKASDMMGYGQQKASDYTGYGQQKASDTTGYGQQQMPTGYRTGVAA